MPRRAEKSMQRIAIGPENIPATISDYFIHAFSSNVDFPLNRTKDNFRFHYIDHP